MLDPMGMADRLRRAHRVIRMSIVRRSYAPHDLARARAGDRARCAAAYPSAAVSGAAMIAALIGFVVFVTVVVAIVAHLGLSMLSLVVVVQSMAALFVLQSLAERRPVLWASSVVVYVVASVAAVRLMV